MTGKMWKKGIPASLVKPLGEPSIASSMSGHQGVEKEDGGTLGVGAIPFGASEIIFRMLVRHGSVPADLIFYEMKSLHRRRRIIVLPPKVLAFSKVNV